MDRKSEEYFDHDMFTPHIIKSDEQKFLKMMGSIVVPGVHVVKVQLDKHFQAMFDKQRMR